MKKFYINLFLYCTPVFCVLLTVAYVDPYCLFHKDRQFSKVKYDIGYSFDQGRRYKLFSFLNSPKPNIILGASEINVIHERNIPEEGWHSLSFGGAPLEESMDLFWKIVNENKIERLLFAPEFIKFYNACLGELYAWNSSQSARAYELYNDKLDYVIDKNVIRSTYYCLLNDLGISSERGKPRATKEEFWKHQLDYGREQYTKKILADKLKNIYLRLSEIGVYCKNNGIEVTIVLPIQHVDLISLEYSADIYPLYRDYLAELIDIFGSVYYYDYPNPNSMDGLRFSDPFHYTSADIYLESLWGDKKNNYLLLDSEKDILKVDSLRNSLLNISEIKK